MSKTDYTETIAALELLIKKLDVPKRSLEKTMAREKRERASHIEKLSEYHAEWEVMDAYGWDIITEAEKNLLLEMIEKGRDFIDNYSTPYETRQRRYQAPS